MISEDRLDLPAPGWNPVSEGYWLAAGRGELVVQCCGSCGRHRWPPGWACYHCFSMDWLWDAVPGTGTVFSYTWADRRSDDVELYNIAVVELDGTRGEPVRIASRVVDIERAALHCGLPVEAVFQSVDSEVSIPFFRPRR